MSLFSIPLFLVFTFSYFSRANPLDNNKYQIVEGVISNFKTEHKCESFQVGEKLFAYSAGGEYKYSKTRSLGGILNNGKTVKIHYFEEKEDSMLKGDRNKILILEMKKEDIIVDFYTFLGDYGTVERVEKHK